MGTREKRPRCGRACRSKYIKKQKNDTAVSFFFAVFIPIIRHCKVYYHTIAASALLLALNLKVGVVGRLTYVGGNVLAVFFKEFAIRYAFGDNCFGELLIIFFVKI